MFSAQDIYNEAIREAVLNRSFASAGLAAGTNAGTFKTANIMPFTIDGVWYSKAITDNIAFVAPSGAFAVQAQGETRYYTLQIDAAGNITVKQSAAGGPMLMADRNRTMFGYIKVVAATGAFTPGTTALGSGTLTVTYGNVACQPLNLQP